MGLLVLGRKRARGTGLITLPPWSVAAVGSPIVSGQGALTLPPWTVAAEGEVNPGGDGEFNTTDAEVWPTTGSAGANKYGWDYRGATLALQSGLPESGSNTRGLVNGSGQTFLDHSGASSGVTLSIVEGGAPNGDRCFRFVIPAGSGEITPGEAGIEYLSMAPHTQPLAIYARWLWKITAGEHYPNDVKNLRFAGPGQWGDWITTFGFRGNNFTWGSDSYEAGVVTVSGSPTITDYGGTPLWIKCGLEIVQHASAGSIRMRTWLSDPDDRDTLIEFPSRTISSINTAGLYIGLLQGPRGTTNAGARANAVTEEIAHYGVYTTEASCGVPYSIAA